MDRYTWTSHGEKAKANLSRIHVSKKLEGHELTIVTEHKLFTGAHVDYRIRVPRNSNLAIRHGTGTVIVDEVSGDINATARYGDVMVDLPQPGNYEIFAESKIGTIYSDFGGSVHHPNLWLSEKLEATGEGRLRQVHLRVGIGGITIQKMSANPLISLKLSPI